jgi:hypothetical protein
LFQAEEEEEAERERAEEAEAQRSDAAAASAARAHGAERRRQLGQLQQAQDFTSTGELVLQPLRVALLAARCLLLVAAAADFGVDVDESDSIGGGVGDRSPLRGMVAAAAALVTLLPEEAGEAGEAGGREDTLEDTQERADGCVCVLLAQARLALLLALGGATRCRCGGGGADESRRQCWACQLLTSPANSGVQVEQIRNYACSGA